MSLFNIQIPIAEKAIPHHPWEKVIKDEYSGKVKYAHNSVKNPWYPKKEEKKPLVPEGPRVRFTILGIRVTREFIYCAHLVKGLHKYRRKYFDAPIIRGVTTVEWPQVLNDLKLRYGGLAFCLNSQVAVLLDDTLLGGESELKELIESKFVYHLSLDYCKEGISQFATYVKSSGRPCAYFHFSIDNKEVGSMIFMLYSDIVPYTCDNFLRLCKQSKGGYGGTPVHRIVKDGWIQCGGFGLKDNTDLGCENFIVPHDRRGVLCMANDGRNVDCSTQFFVLLQPAQWMAYKYVAFGQLIDGESTLKKIEQVPTFYEAPLKEIKIYRSGIFNMDCQDIMINKKTKEYVFGHIDDLYVIGEIFYEELLGRVFAEITLKAHQVMTAEDVRGEHAEGEVDVLKDSKRFIQKKEDIDKALGRSQGNQISEQELLAEEYEDEYEGTAYRHASISPKGSLVVKPEIPYYLPLTDVPYPDDTDSTFNLRKFVRGDYCLESDLERKSHAEAPKQKNAYPSDVLTKLESSSSESSSSLELDSDEEKEIKIYLSQNVDRVSFAGDIVKQIAKGIAKFNIFDDATKSEMVISDEALRRVRTVSADINKKEMKIPARLWSLPSDTWAGTRCERASKRLTKVLAHEKCLTLMLPFTPGTCPGVTRQAPQTRRKVSVSIADEDVDKVHRQIKRRQTGFLRPDDLERIRQVAKSKEENQNYEEDDEEYEAPTSRHVSMTIDHDENKVVTKIKRRQTGFVRPAMLQKIHMYESFEEENDDDDPNRKVRIVPKYSRPSRDRSLRQYSMDRSLGHKSSMMRRSAGYVRSTMDPGEFEVDFHRPSVLKRLYEDVAIDEDENIPTLKDYKPKTELQNKSLLLTTTVEKFLDADESREKYYYRPSMMIEASEHENVLNLQHGKKIARKISSDYVKTIDQIEQRQEASIRSVEFAKSRPALSVTDYQKKNSKIQEELRNSFKIQVKNQHTEGCQAAGLRLPGDTPLYSQGSIFTGAKRGADEHPEHINILRSKLAKVARSRQAHT